MCGLLASIDSNKKPKNVNHIVVDLYEEQYTRGERGFGIITIDKNKKIKLTRATEPAKFMYDLHNQKSNIVFAHHRTPTSTDNKLGQTHPIFVSNKMLKFDYYVMHNGVIRNCDELKKKHEELGFKYTTEIETWNYYQTVMTLKFNDSEAMAIEIAMFLEGIKGEVEFDGSAAFLIQQVNKKTKKLEQFFFGRHVNPLNYNVQKGIITIASEGPGEELKENIIYSMDPTNVKTIKENQLYFKEKPVKTITTYGTYNIPKTDDKKEEKKTKQNTVDVGWTEEDEAEEDIRAYNASYGVGLDDYEDYERDYRNGGLYKFDNIEEYVKDEMEMLIEDFLFELKDEDSAITANIPQHLALVKSMLKTMKGLAISHFRNEKKKEEQETENLQAQGLFGKEVEKNYQHKEKEEVI